MKQLDISYSVFKTITTTYGLSIYYAPDTNGMYSAYSSSRDFIYICKIQAPNDIIDFETNLKSTSTEVLTNDDAIALATYPYKWAKSGYEIAQKSLYVDGRVLVVPAGENTAYVEWVYSSMIELQGIDGAASNGGAVFGDYINMGIYHPLAGEVNRFGNQVYLIGNQEYGTVSDKVSQIPAGVKIRLTYNAVDTNGRQMIARLRVWK